MQLAVKWPEASRMGLGAAQFSSVAPFRGLMKFPLDGSRCIAAPSGPSIKTASGPKVLLCAGDERHPASEDS
jgi:hypothetical protein